MRQAFKEEDTGLPLHHLFLDCNKSMPRQRQESHRPTDVRSQKDHFNLEWDSSLVDFYIMAVVRKCFKPGPTFEEWCLWWVPLDGMPLAWKWCHRRKWHHQARSDVTKWPSRTTNWCSWTVAKTLLVPQTLNKECLPCVFLQLWDFSGSGKFWLQIPHWWLKNFCWARNQVVFHLLPKKQQTLKVCCHTLSSTFHSFERGRFCLKEDEMSVSSLSAVGEQTIRGFWNEMNYFSSQT